MRLLSINEYRRFSRFVPNGGLPELMTLTPPAITGGLVVQNANPFDYLFDPPYGLNLIRPVRNTIDSNDWHPDHWQI